MTALWRRENLLRYSFVDPLFAASWTEQECCRSQNSFDSLQTAMKRPFSSPSTGSLLARIVSENPGYAAVHSSSFHFGLRDRSCSALDGSGSRIFQLFWSIRAQCNLLCVRVAYFPTPLERAGVLGLREGSVFCQRPPACIMLGLTVRMWCLFWLPGQALFDAGCSPLPSIGFSLFRCCYDFSPQPVFCCGTSLPSCRFSKLAFAPLF